MHYLKLDTTDFSSAFAYHLCGFVTMDSYSEKKKVHFVIILFGSILQSWRS